MQWLTMAYFLQMVWNTTVEEVKGDGKRVLGLVLQDTNTKQLREVAVRLNSNDVTYRGS